MSTYEDRVRAVQERRGHTDIPAFDRIEAEIEIANDYLSEGVTINLPPRRPGHWERSESLTRRGDLLVHHHWVDDGVTP